MTQQNAARNRKHTPPLNSVQLGVQMRFTTGQMWVKWKKSPAAIPISSGNEEFLHGNFGSGFAQPPPRDQSQNHGAQGGNEAQRQVSAVVINPRRCAREEIQEPLIEGVPKLKFLFQCAAKPV